MEKWNKKLLLEDGSQFYGYGFGSQEEKITEIVFNTAPVGYQVGNVLKHPMDTLEYAIVPMVFRSLKIADELAASSIVRGIESPYKKESYYVSRIAALDCFLIVVSVGATVCCCLL